MVIYDGPDLWKYSRPVEQIDQKSNRVVQIEKYLTYLNAFFCESSGILTRTFFPHLVGTRRKRDLCQKWADADIHLWGRERFGLHHCDFESSGPSNIKTTPLTWKNSFLMDTIKVKWLRFSKLILWYSFFKIGRIEENGLKNLDNGIKWCLNTLVLLLWIIYQFDWVLSSSDNRSKKGTEYILPIPFSFPLRAGTGNRPAISEHREIRQIIWFIIYDSEYCRHSWQEKSFLNGTNNQEK